MEKGCHTGGFRRILTIMKVFVREGRCFFCARSDPGIFVPFFMRFGGEPYGREQN